MCAEGRVKRGSLVEEGDERRWKEGRMVGRKSDVAQGEIGGHGVLFGDIPCCACVTREQPLSFIGSPPTLEYTLS